MEIYWLEQTESDVPTGNGWLSAKETICLSAMRVAKRYADWRLGRWTAKRAVAVCRNLPADLYSLAGIEIRAASSGAPEVFLQDQPANLAISLSHRDRTALCAVAPAGTNIGCDLETIEPRSEAFVADYFTANEKTLIAQTPVEEQPLLVALLWSGKESALKALHVGLRLDTRCMSVSPADAWPQTSGERAKDPRLFPRAFSPGDWRPLSVGYSGGQIFGGWWRAEDQLVRTAVSDAPMCAPVPARRAWVNE